MLNNAGDIWQGGQSRSKRGETSGKKIKDRLSRDFNFLPEGKKERFNSGRASVLIKIGIPMTVEKEVGSRPITVSAR